MIKIILLIIIVAIILYKWDLDEILILISEIKLKCLELWIKILGGKKQDDNKNNNQQ